MPGSTIHKGVRAYSDPDDFWWNFNSPRSADYYLPSFIVFSTGKRFMNNEANLSY